jgi:hypothetical protein
VKICELCREQIEAVELVEALTFGPKRELLEGKPVLFHRRHYPAGSGRYRLSAA